jgi:hypothetical protein
MPDPSYVAEVLKSQGFEGFNILLESASFADYENWVCDADSK